MDRKLTFHRDNPVSSTISLNTIPHDVYMGTFKRYRGEGVNQTYRGTVRDGKNRRLIPSYRVDKSRSNLSAR
jgi:hypothetical protein